MRILIVLVVLLSASSASAQFTHEANRFYEPKPDIAFRISLVAAVAAHGADLATTEFGLGTGRVREINPWLTRFSTQPAVFGATKMGIAAFGLWGTAKLHETHPRWALVANLAQTAAFSAIAVHNTRVSR